MSCSGDGVVIAGLLQDGRLELQQHLVESVEDLAVGLDAFPHQGVREVVAQSDSIASVVDALVEGGQVVLSVGVLDVSQQLALVVHEVHAAAKQISGRAHGLGVGVGYRKHAPAQQAGDLLRVDLVVLGLASVDRFHVQRVTEDERDSLLGTHVGDPVPGEDALDRHHDVCSIGVDRLQQMLAVSGQVAVQDDRACLVDDADVHAPCMQIDPAIVLVLARVEVHRGLLLKSV